jgi:hypothetical protein
MVYFQVGDGENVVMEMEGGNNGDDGGRNSKAKFKKREL